MSEELKVGDRVAKVDGKSRFPGEVRAMFKTSKGETRAIVEADASPDYEGLLHIYRPEQLERREEVAAPMDVRVLLAFMREDVRRQHERLGRPDSPDRDGRPTFKHTADRRINIFSSQFGDACRFAYSDRDVEPSHRGYKTPAEEDSSYGHAILQLLACAAARGVDIERGIALAYHDIDARGWAHKAQQAEPRGIVACWPYGHIMDTRMLTVSIQGVLVRPTDDEPTRAAAKKVSSRLIMLFEHARPEDTPLMLAKDTFAVLAEQGSMTCHAGVVCRESATPCIAGTGKITWPSGSMVELHADGRVKLIAGPPQ